MRAGIGTAPITPAPPVYLAGFGARTEPATSVHDELEARALYLDDGETAVVLVVCDLLGMSSGFSLPIRRAIASELLLDIGQVLISCTHTHQGPSAIAGTEAIGWPIPKGYADVLREGCVAAARAACAGAAQATLRYARAPLPDGFAFNRRGLPFDEPWFGVLDVLGDDGRIGVVANLSIHPVLLGPRWYAVATDWVGPMRRTLESSLGGTAIELTGALGDINPTPPDGKPDEPYEPWASAEHTTDYGERLGAIVAEAVDTTDHVGATITVLRSETHDIPVGGTPIAALHGEPTMKVDLVEWDVGGVKLVSLPGEAFHLLGREISSARGGRALLAGLAPAWHGYLPHPWGEGGYEEGVSFGEEFARTVRELLVSSVPPASPAAGAAP
jgi:neutral ceramidase